MSLTKILAVSSTLNAHLDLCLSCFSATEIKYPGRNGRASWLILFAGRNLGIILSPTTLIFAFFFITVILDYILFDKLRSSFLEFHMTLLNDVQLSRQKIIG